MKSRVSRLVWPIIGLVAVCVSAWLLYKEFRNLSLADIATSLGEIPPHRWMAAVLATLAAYAALAAYDRIALLHLGKQISWRFVAVASFTAYALSHSIGFSLFSGAVVRYRAYTSQGLTAAEVGVLVAVCSLTFVFGTLILGGALLVTGPAALQRFVDVPTWLAFAVGMAALGLVAFYILGSLLHLKPISIGGFQLYYPRPPIVALQVIVAPLEIVSAAAIIYFCLPAEGNPGYLAVLGIFIVSFSLALASHAPGGLGVLEYVFLSWLDEIDPAQVVAALIIFRILYLLVPLAVSLIVVLLFERRQFLRHGKERPATLSRR
jgi:uncharacterized membrane protein YbhN (UPF0104 family)